MTYKPSKVDQGDLFLVHNKGSLVGLCTSLCVQQLRFVPPWLTTRQTHIQTSFDQLI